MPAGLLDRMEENRESMRLCGVILTVIAYKQNLLGALSV